MTASLRRKFERYLRSLKRGFEGWTSMVSFTGCLYMFITRFPIGSNAFDFFCVGNPLEFAGIGWPDMSALEEYKDYLRILRSPPPLRPKLDLVHLPVISTEFNF